MHLDLYLQIAKNVGGMKPLIDFFSHETVITIVNFLILVALLRHFLYKPVLNMLAKREEQIEGAISGASAEMDEAQRLKKEYTELLAQSRNEAQNIIDRARKQGDQMVLAAEDKANQEAAAIIERARAEIELERETMYNEVRAQMATLAILAAEKLLEKNLDSDTNRKLVNDFVAKVGDN